MNKRTCAFLAGFACIAALSAVVHPSPAAAEPESETDVLLKLPIKPGLSIYSDDSLGFVRNDNGPFAGSHVAEGSVLVVDSREPSIRGFSLAAAASDLQSTDPVSPGSIAKSAIGVFPSFLDENPLTVEGTAVASFEGSGAFTDTPTTLLTAVAFDDATLAGYGLVDYSDEVRVHASLMFFILNTVVDNSRSGLYRGRLTYSVA